MPVANTFKALGDPVRLKMIERLSKGTPQTLGSVSESLGITRQAARKHLQILAEANLITIKPAGRHTAVIIDLTTIKATAANMAWHGSGASGMKDWNLYAISSKMKFRITDPAFS